jgi:hypothetical protein
MNKYKYIIMEPFSKTFHYLLPLVRYYCANYQPVASYAYSNLWPEYSIDTGHLVCMYKINKPSITKFLYHADDHKQIIDTKIEDGYVYILCSLQDWMPEVALFLAGKYSEFSDDAKALICKCFGGKPDKPITVDSAPNKKVIAMLSPFLMADEINEELEDYIGASLDECREAVGIMDAEKETLVLENA